MEVLRKDEIMGSVKQGTRDEIGDI